VNPIAATTHLAAIVAGVWGGITLMGALAPDLPDDEVEAAVSTASDTPVPAGGAESLLRTENLTPALSELSSQLTDAGVVVRLRIEPGNLDADEGEGGFEPLEVPAFGPERLAEEIARERPEFRGLADISYVEVVQTDIGPEWHVQLITDRPGLSPPWTYGAPLDLGGLTVGGAPPEQIDSP
jgi:hypothetical protein